MLNLLQSTTSSSAVHLLLLTHAQLEEVARAGGGFPWARFRLCVARPHPVRYPHPCTFSLGTLLSPCTVCGYRCVEWDPLPEARQLEAQMQPHLDTVCGSGPHTQCALCPHAVHLRSVHS